MFENEEFAWKILIQKKKYIQKNAWLLYFYDFKMFSFIVVIIMYGKRYQLIFIYVCVCMLCMDVCLCA